MRSGWVILAAVSIAAATPAAAAGRFDDEVAATKAAMMTTPAIALRHAVAAQTLATAMGDTREGAMAGATALWLRGEATTRIGEPQQAMPLLAKALATVERIAPRDKLHGDILLSRGWIDGSLGQVQLALQDFQNAHNIFRAADDVRGQTKALGNIAGIYHDAGDNARSLTYYAQAAELSTGDPAITLAAHNNVGEALKALGRYHAAEAEYDQALSAARRMASPGIEVHILSNLASAQLMAGDAARAEQTARRALALAQRPDAADERPFVMGVLAQIALKHGRVDEAAALITQTFAGQDLAETPLPFRDFHKSAAEIFARQGRHDLAYAHLTAFKRLDDGVRALAASTNSALMAARFDFTNQDLKITRLTAGALKLRTLILSVALGAAGLIFVLLFVSFLSLRRSRNEVRAANAQLSETNVSLEKALRAKTEFLATTSHEIRTPLNGILGTTQVVLADGRVEGWLRDKISLVHSAGETMKALVDDILDLAKIETGKLSIREGEVPLKRMLRDAHLFWSGPGEGKGLAMHAALNDCPERIFGDEARLRQIIFNLMSNATKFTSEGEVSLAVATEGQGDEERLLVRISDTGIGIPAHEHDAIFEKFYQVDTGTSRQFGGTGLGLAICRSLADAMDGRIAVESAPGHGAIFTLSLPLRRVAAKAEAVGESGGGQVTVLLVEPNPLTQRIIAKSLRGAAMVDAVGTIDLVADRLRARRYDHVVVQLDAGEPPTAEALAALAGLVPILGDARLVVLFTPGGIDADGLQAMGVTHAVAKPFSAKHLALLIGDGGTGHVLDRQAFAPAA